MAGSVAKLPAQIAINDSVFSVSDLFATGVADDHRADQLRAVFLFLDLKTDHGFKKVRLG